MVIIFELFIVIVCEAKLLCLLNVFYVIFVQMLDSHVICFYMDTHSRIFELLSVVKMLHCNVRYTRVVP